MYTISLLEGDKNIVIYNDLYPNASYIKLINPELDMKVNTAGTLTFIMPPSNIGYDLIKPITSTIVVSKDDNWLWTGRPITISKDFWLQKKVVCEGALAFLNDIIAPLHKYSNITATNYITQLLNIYQDRITMHGYKKVPERMFSLSPFVTNETAAHNPISTVEYVTEDDSILSYIKKFVDDYGLYIRLKEVIVTNQNTYTGQAFKIEIVNDTQLDLCQQEINFGKNLLDYSDNYEWSDIITVLHPIGAKLDSISQTGDEDYPDHLTLATTNTSNPNLLETTGDGITEKSDSIIEVDSENPYIVGSLGTPSFVGALSDDDQSDENDENQTESDTTLEPQSSNPFSVVGEYLVNMSAVSLYGRIEETVNWSEVDDRETLRTLAELYLSDYQYDNLELTVKVIDLHYLSSSNASIKFLNKVNCVSEPHNMYTTFIVTEMKIPFDKPENTTISFSRNKSGYKSDGSSGGKTAKSGNLSFATSQIISKNEVMKEARDHAAAMMDMHTTGYVSFIAPIDSDDPNFPVVDKNRLDHVGEIWITNNIDPNRALKRWRWNVNGLAHQTRETIGDDWGSPNVAITMDGSIVASYITTGVLVVPNGTTINPRTRPAIWDASQPFDVNDPSVLFRADMVHGTCCIAGFVVDNTGFHSPGKTSLTTNTPGVFLATYDAYNRVPGLNISYSGDMTHVSYGEITFIGNRMGPSTSSTNYIHGHISTVGCDSYGPGTVVGADGMIIRTDGVLYLCSDSIKIGDYDLDITNVKTGISQNVYLGEMTLEFKNGICVGAGSNGSSSGGETGGGISEIGGNL